MQVQSCKPYIPLPRRSITTLATLGEGIIGCASAIRKFMQA